MNAFFAVNCCRVQPRLPTVESHPTFSAASDGTEVPCRLGDPTWMCGFSETTPSSKTTGF